MSLVKPRQTLQTGVLKQLGSSAEEWESVTRDRLMASDSRDVSAAFNAASNRDSNTALVLQEALEWLNLPVYRDEDQGHWKKKSVDVFFSKSEFWEKSLTLFCFLLLLKFVHVNKECFFTHNSYSRSSTGLCSGNNTFRKHCIFFIAVWMIPSFIYHLTETFSLQFL